MKTKIGALKPNVKRRVLGENPTYDEKMIQVLYEMYNNGIANVTAFNDRIKYLKSKETPNEKLISRMKILRDFFKENRNDIMEKLIVSRFFCSHYYTHRKALQYIQFVFIESFWFL